MTMRARASLVVAALAMTSGAALAQSATPPDGASSPNGAQHPVYRPLSSFPKGKTAATPTSEAVPYVVPAHPPAPSGDDGGTAGKSNPE